MRGFALGVETCPASQASASARAASPIVPRAHRTARITDRLTAVDMVPPGTSTDRTELRSSLMQPLIVAIAHRTLSTACRTYIGSCTGNCNENCVANLRTYWALLRDGMKRQLSRTATSWGLWHAWQW